ncbi:hypothetical protein [Halomarina oriensis]|uniref:Uncharacterized protein n=1 Tax=Halomarina oriensis TaxID=671145 RepID=A0A6B0GGT8_9EURY|nr:hypothetical protein [Halomarina oriensis]MWG32951.1 hypothetical protein [Halomarina oriensis]
MDDRPDDDPPLELAREEARLTLDAQLSTLDDIDAKALSVFRLNVALATLLVSASTLAATSDVTTVATLVSPVVVGSVGLFALSAATAGLTYTAAGRYVGVGPATLDAATDRSRTAFLSSLVGGYADWIRANERTNDRKALLVTLSVVGTVAGTLALGVGVVAAATGALVVPGLSALVVLAVLTALSGLPDQVGRLRDDDDGLGTVAPESLDGPASGQRTFTGRDRET